MSKPRSRHPDEPRQTWINKKGQLRNGRSHHPIKYEDPAMANAAKRANGPEFPGADGPSSRMLAIIQSGAILPPKQIAGIRQSIVNVVERNIQRAENVLEGTEVWTTQQTSLFVKLLDKVAPTMTESLHRSAMQPAAGNYSRMSLVDLERALQDVLKEPEVIDVEPEVTKETKEAPKVNPEYDKRRLKERRLRVKAHGATILETRPETVLPPLTREQDDEKRRQAKQAAKGLRKRAARKAIIKDLELMAQNDPKT